MDINNVISENIKCFFLLQSESFSKNSKSNKSIKKFVINFSEVCLEGILETLRLYV